MLHFSHPTPNLAMEDLWKDITLSTLATLHNPSTPTPTPTTIPADVVARRRHFQDFLARPLSLHDKGILVSAGSTNSAHSPVHQTIPSLPTTDGSSGHSPPPNIVCPFDHSFSSVKARAQEAGESDEADLNTCDRRHKRMIKNRESAARSRARKQAYTNELELEVAHLKQENARLRMEQAMHYQAAATPEQAPKKLKSHRASTAPF